MPAPNKDAENWGEMPQFRTLRRMVTLLTATLSIGVLAIAVTLVIRIASEPGAPAVTSLGVEAVTLPADAEIIAVGATGAALTIAVKDPNGRERVLTFHPKTGEQVGETIIRRK